PLVAAAILEADEEDPLVLAEVEGAFAERDLLRPRPEQERDEACALVQLQRHQTLEHDLQIREEARLALLDANQGRVAVRRDEGDAAPTAARDRAAHVVRDVEDGEVRERRGDRD